MYGNVSKIENYLSAKHKLGNIITGLLKICEGFIIVLSLGKYNSSLSFNWTCYRIKNKFLKD